ncbi:hypothetical protein EIP91_003202 [Steccherinum ochraceum]|uniref:C3H1-type domain-containing protein n=1 Tax=Steccherinum ochraceum TaxID=92696 RepID=A0A4R0RZE9_9APHY|nr:hypothetical protein EIP91_003202 [Steccherinum ochraceum]
MDPSSSAAALKLEIARLTGAINRRKAEDPKPPRAQSYPATSRPRHNVYVNPSYKPPSSSKPVVPPSSTTFRPQILPTVPPSTATRDVVIGGVAFQTSGRSLVRKDLPKPARSTAPKPLVARGPTYPRQKPANRIYKPKSSRGRPTNRNMTLTNTRRPYQPRAKQRKYVDRPCPRFTTTGSCNRGLTCPYQHDPSKIAICWPFLQGSCPNTAETCNLSHDPTPNRTPLCVHFANNGRCTRQNCPFPHVRVGQRQGVCRDFAVLGYCDKGLDCDKQHVRECPDFAENGACTTVGCKLPHVIRANRNRAAQGVASTAAAAGPKTSGPTDISTPGDHGADVSSVPQVTAEDAQLGDEYISLTFNESESEDDDDEEEEEGDEEGDDDNDEEDGEDVPPDSDKMESAD